ncbi:hypothetical protein [Oryzobacter terrae]|uniref:hypothetical protein n=1 Tax=Oryzobacter terrae TaxID=1620385 RepID=UPI00366D7D48
MARLTATEVGGSVTTGPALTPVVPRALVTPGAARVLVQLGCLAAIVALPASSVPGGSGLLVEAQVLAAVCVYLVLRAARPSIPALSRTVRVWGLGAVVALLCQVWLHDGLGMDHRAAQLCAVGALVALLGLGRMYVAYREAGTQIDALFATLPPRENDRLLAG